MARQVICSVWQWFESPGHPSASAAVMLRLRTLTQVMKVGPMFL